MTSETEVEAEEKDLRLSSLEIVKDVAAEAATVTIDEEYTLLSPEEEAEEYKRLSKEEQEEHDRPSQAEMHWQLGQQETNADFARWGAYDSWTIDEAVALTLGKAPEIATWKHIREYSLIHKFAKEYERRRDLANRAVLSEILSITPSPTIFLKWAKAKNLDIPPELTHQVNANNKLIAAMKVGGNPKECNPTAQAHKLNRTAVDPAIDEAIILAGNMELADVALQLKILALKKRPPFTGEVKGSDFCYIDNNDKPRTFTRNALTKRLLKRKLTPL